MKKVDTLRLSLAALFLALGLILPFLTGQIPQIGTMLSPMHLPVLLCGFVCGWPYGLAVGFIMPLLRSLLFGMPPMVPTPMTSGAIAMAFEMAVYGAMAGLLYQKLPKKPVNVYMALFGAMLCGRVAWGLVSVPLYLAFLGTGFTAAMFWAGAFVKAWPGMLAQVVLVPLVVFALQRMKLLPLQRVVYGRGAAKRA